MSYKVFRWMLKLFLLAQLVSHIYALETKKRANSPDQQWKTAQAGYNSAKQKQQQILQANAAEASPPAWAGSYYQGDGLGMNVTVVLSDKAGAAVSMQGDVGNSEGSIGSVEPLPNGHLVIRLEHPVMGFDDEDYVPTKWAGRMYLIASDELMRFASDINRGSEPRETKQGNYFLREGDEKQAVKGLPALPAEASVLIKSKPLLVRVTSVQMIKLEKFESGCARHYRVQVDHGSTAGLAKGITLDALGKGWEEINLTEVNPSQAFARFEDYLGTCDRPGEVPVRGDVFTTGSYPPAPKSKANNEQCPKTEPAPAQSTPAAHPQH